MVVNVCGFGWSGSGAYLDLLREYDELCFPSSDDWEFNFLWAPDGLYDLEQKLCVKHCRIFDSDLAISRFLSIAREYGDPNGSFKYDDVFKTSFYSQCEEYISKLVQFKLKTYSFSHKLHPTTGDKFVNLYNRLLGKFLLNRVVSCFCGKRLYEQLRCNNYKEMQVSYMPENFVEITQNFVAELLNQIRPDCTKSLVLNQSVPPDVPHLFAHFFKEVQKTIIVRRDPRDMFITINRLKGISRPVPTNVDDFITFYRKTIGETILPDSTSLLSISFEDLIYDYDNTVLKIESFLNIKNHVDSLKFFKPQTSINNTQLFLLFPEFWMDVKKIESALSDYLYPFERHEYNRTSNIIF